MVSTTNDLRIRLSEQQRVQLEELARLHGFTTLSAYARSRLFENLGIHDKLNTIMNLIMMGEVGKRKEGDLWTRKKEEDGW